jgi:hypothetical protein
MVDDQEAARGQPVPVAGQYFAWAVLVRDEMQRAGAQERDRPGQVQQRPHVGVVQDRFRLTQVGVHHHGSVRLGEQRLAMGPDHRVVVHVGDPRGRGMRQRRLVHAELGRQSRAEVEELLDTRLAGNVAHRPGQERPAVPGDGRDIGNRGEQLGRGGAVNGEVILAAKQEIINPSHVGRRHIHAAWDRHRLHHLERNTVLRILAKDHRQLPALRGALPDGQAVVDVMGAGPGGVPVQPLDQPRHRQPGDLLLTVPSLIVMALFMFYPLIRAAWLSLTSYSFFGTSKFIGLGNYGHLLHDSQFWTDPRLPARGALRAAIFLPAVVSLAVAAIPFRLLFTPSIGLITYWLALIGFHSTDWLDSTTLAMPAALIIIFPLVWVFANSIKPEGEIITGHPGLFSDTITGSNYVQTWDAIDFPRLLLNTVIIEYGLVMADSVLAIAPMVVAFLLIQRRFTESIATSGLR